MDFSMPNMNGVDAAPVLKRMLPDVPIVVFTIFNDALGSRLSSAVAWTWLFRRRILPNCFSDPPFNF